MTEYEKEVRKAGLTEQTNWMTFAAKIDSMNKELERDLGLMNMRRECISKYGFAILTEKALRAVKKYAPIVEIGAGTGYWAYEFQKREIDYIATEPYPNGFHFNHSKLWVKMKKMTGVKAARKYPDRTLLMCWPSYDERWPARAIKAYEGNQLIYVGEGRGGCTGDDRFHELLDSWDLKETINIPQWIGIHDRIEVFER